MQEPEPEPEPKPGARSQGARSQEPEAKRAKGPASKEEFVPIEGIDSVCPE